MNVEFAPSSIRRAFGGAWFLLLAGALGFGFLALVPFPWGLVGAGAGVGLGGLLRASRWSSARAVAPLPPLVGLGAVAALVPIDVLVELYAGLVALAYLVWLADDPDRLPGGPLRALRTLSIPAIGFALAWLSSFLIPDVGAPLGVAVVLLAAVGAAVAFLLRTPESFDRDPAATS
jgi:hypothetical protein